MPWRARIVVRVFAPVPAYAPDAGHQRVPCRLAVEREGELRRGRELGPAGPQLGANGAQPVSGQGAPPLVDSEVMVQVVYRSVHPLVDTPQGTGRGSMDSAS